MVAEIERHPYLKSLDPPLNVAKTCQVNDISTTVIKMNKDIMLISLRAYSLTVLLMVNFLMN